MQQPKIECLISEHQIQNIVNDQAAQIYGHYRNREVTVTFLVLLTAFFEKIHFVDS